MRLFNKLSASIAAVALVGAACAPAAQPVAAPAAPAPAAAPKQPAAAAPAAPAAKAQKGAGAAPAKAAAQPAAAKPKAAAAKIKRGGYISTAQRIEAPHFDGLYLNSVSLGSRVMGTVYNRALRYKTGPDMHPNEIVLEPDLAESWEVSGDGKTIIFHVRKGVKWHNIAPVNGRELVANDFVTSYTRLWKTPGSGSAPYFINVSKIEAPDKYTVKITMKKPSATFLTLMAHVWSFIHPPEVVERDGDVKRVTIGTGPFILDQVEKSVITSVKRNPDYWGGPELPYMDGSKVYYIPESSAQVAAFRAGQLDTMSLRSRADIESIHKTRDDVKTISKYPHAGFCKFHFDTEKPPWNDVRLRQALSLTINREADIATFFGSETKYIGMISDGFVDALGPKDLGEGSKYLVRDLAAAEQLVKDAGYPVPFEFNYLHDLLFDSRVARFTNDMLEGPFKPKVKAMTVQEYLTSAYIGKWPAGYGVTFGCGPVNIDAGAFLGSLFHPSSTVTNNSRVNDPELTKMIEDQDGMIDPVERTKAVHEIQRYAAIKMYYIPLTLGTVHAMSQPWVENWNDTIGFNMADVYRHTWLNK